MSHYRPFLNNDWVWVTVPHFAFEFNKAPITIWKWCDSGYITTLGYRLIKSPSCQAKTRSHYRIGIRQSEYINFGQVVPFANHRL